MAAKAHERAAAATWDVFRPFPIVSEQVDVVLDVFAPRNPAEFHRVLRPGGVLVVVRPFTKTLSSSYSRHSTLPTILRTTFLIIMPTRNPGNLDVFGGVDRMETS